jgi:hypothetical protein
MKKPLGRILRIGAVAAGFLVLILAAAALIFLFDKPLVRSIVRDQLAKRTGMTVRIGRLDYSLFPFRAKAEGLELGREDAYYRMAVSVARLEAVGDIRKLVGGRRPALASIEADGLVIRVEEKAVSREPLDLEALVREASDALAWTRGVSVTNARLYVSLISQEAKLENLNITLTPQGTDGTVVYSIGPCAIDINDKGRAAGLSGVLSSSGTFRTASSPSIEGRLSFRSPRVAAPGIDEAFDGAGIEIEGRFDLAPREFAVTSAKMALPGLLDVDATGRGKVADGVSVEAEVRARFEKLENLAARLGPHLPAEFRSALLKGKAELSFKSRIDHLNGESKGGLSGVLSLDGVEAEFRGARLRGNAEIRGEYRLDRSKGAMVPPLEKGGRGDFFDGSLVLEGVEIDGIIAGTPLRLGISGRLQAAGPSRDPHLSADIRTAVGRTALGKLAFGGADIRLAGTATKEAADISRLDAVLNGVDLDPAPGKRISFEKITLAGISHLDLSRKTATIKALLSGIPDIAPLVLTARLGTGIPPAAEVRLEGKNLDIPAVRTLAFPFVPESLAAWDVGGTADVALEARRPAASGGAWSFSGAVSLAQARFNDPSFTIASEGLDPALKVEGSWAASKGVSFTGGLDIGRGESLWKTIYVSWSKHPLKATFAGRYDPASGEVEGLAARFLFPTIGEVGVSGSLQSRPAPAFDLKADARLSLGPLYSLTSQAGGAQPNRMSLEGTLGAALLAHGANGALSIEGRLTLADTKIILPSTETRLLGITADIPIRYDSAISEPAPPEGPLPEEGFLRIEEFRNPVLTLKLVAVSLRVGANAFSVEPLSLELFGGRLELGRTAFRVDPRTGALRGAGSLALRELDISKFPIPSPQFKLTGKVRAEFPRLDIGLREIAVSGRGEADVFGGKVVLRDLAVTDPFTPGRSISLNVDLLDLDLKKLTDEVPFGEVTGIIRGEVRGLVISYGQPARFDLRIESVPRKGVPQTFSLKAVDNLTVLSSGQQASAGTGPFWMRFIRGFRYRKLGIVSTLRNDTFSLNGTILEGGVEYLVKKPALFGINVVNRMPDKKISFREMTGRLKRVGQSEK